MFYRNENIFLGFVSIPLAYFQLLYLYNTVLSLPFSEGKECYCTTSSEYNIKMFHHLNELYMMTPVSDLQIYGDPEAADVVFTSGANITVVGINITTQVQFTGGTPVYSLFNFSTIFSCCFKGTVK